jgi:5,5'-dehydrodivanillate O-demethylase
MFQYALERKGRLTDDPKARYNATMVDQADMLERSDFVRYRAIHNRFGFTKGRLRAHESEEQRSWTVGINPVIFPYMLASGPGDGGIRRHYQIGVPIDDTHTWHFQYFCYVFPPEVEVPDQDRVPYMEVPLRDAQGNYQLDYVLAQDMVAWVEQGEIMDRTQEHLCRSDILLGAYRTLLRREIETVAAGREPMNVFRDPAEIDSPELTIPGNEGEAPIQGTTVRAQVEYRGNYHRTSKGGWLYIDDDADRFCPDRDLIVELYRRTQELAQT